MLASPKWRRIASWITGWLFIVGNITITLAVNFGSTLFFVSCINVFEKEPGVGIFAGETWQVFLIFLALTLFCNAVSAFGNKWLPWLDVSPLISCVFPFVVGSKTGDLVLPLIHPHSMNPGDCEMLTLPIDCRCFLDIRRYHCPHDHHSGPCQGGSKRCQMGLWPL